MCGIVGLAAGRDASEPSLGALKRLEYRGYDSVGLGVVDGGLSVWRKEGRIQALLEGFGGEFPPGATAIAHTRWATHGAPVESNAHPIGDGGLAVVHNGIIENEAALRAELAAGGAVFATETDTEVVLRLLLSVPGDTVEERLPAVLSRLEGAYALAIVGESEPGRVYFARRHSPLVLGLGERETWLASDLSAFLPETRNAVFLEESRHGWITPEGCHIVGPDGEVEEPVVSVLPFNPVAAQKGRFSHFMEKEIHEQPRAFTETLGELLTADGVALPEPAAGLLAGAKRLRLIACGTSWHAALASRIWVEELAGVPCEVEIASEAVARPTLAEEGLVAVAVSQSGETFDTLAAARALKEAGVPLVALVNTQESTLERMADGVLRTRAGPEIGVAASKTHTSQLLVLHLMALHMAAGKEVDVAARVDKLRRLPAFLERVLAESEEPVRKFAREVAGTRNALFLGRHRHFPTAMEGSLKLKEISYIHAEAYPGGEMKHGPIALVDDKLLVVVVAPHDEQFAKLYGNLREVAARRGRILLVTTTDAPAVAEAEETIAFPPCPPDLSAFPALVILQLLAYWIARDLGLDIDQPRNLAKTVTVE